MDINTKNKKIVNSFIQEMNTNNSSKVIAKYFSEDVLINITSPFKQIRGIGSFMHNFWEPIFKAFPDIENQPYILIGGSYEEKNYVQRFR